MTLKDSIRCIVVRDIESRDVLSLDIYAETNHSTIKALYDARVIDDEIVGEALKKSIANTARQDFHLILNKGVWPDHVGSPKCLAYAIANGILSADDVRRIKFDHGQDKDSFCRGYFIGQLVDNLTYRFLNPPSLQRSYPLDDDFDPAC
jgi:hypothetical protein